jgi:hypothetical protein
MTGTISKLKPGDKMDDGTVYAGMSTDTGRPMYTTPADAPLTYTFNEAITCAGQLNAEKYLGHDDWRVPTKSELDVLFNHRAAIGGFNVSGSLPRGWYWSSTEHNGFNAWGQRFSGGTQSWFRKNLDSSLRLVR